MKVTHTFNPENLIVMSGGELVDEYYDAIYAEKRREALHQAGRELVHFTLVTTPVAIGHGILSVLTHIAEQAN